MAEIIKDTPNTNVPKTPQENSIAPTPPVTPKQAKTPAPKPPVPTPSVSAPKPGLVAKPSTKPEEVKLPEKGTPELASGDAVPLKSTPPAPLKSATTQSAPVLETGPVQEKSPKKIGKYIAIVAISLIVLGGILYAYMFIRNMSFPEEIVEVTEVQETTESIVIELPQEDTTSLKALEEKFDEIEEEVVTLERVATFDQEANLSSSDF